MEQILSGLDEALWVDDLLGIGQGNVLSGEFSNTVSLGFLVRKGEIIGRVKNTMIAGNAFDSKIGPIAASSKADEQMASTYGEKWTNNRNAVMKFINERPDYRAIYDREVQNGNPA